MVLWLHCLPFLWLGLKLVDSADEHSVRILRVKCKVYKPNQSSSIEHAQCDVVWQIS